jgi:hypothetical protein
MKKMTAGILLSALLFSCKKEELKNDNLIEGAKQTVYHGKAWSWIKLDGNGAPQQLGISVDEALLNSVTTSGTSTGSGEHHTHENNIVLPLPAIALEKTPFKTIGLDWNPEGHPPANIYTKPHFDFHFYMVTEADRLAAVDPAKLNADPGSNYLPANYIGVDPVPQMGKHWVDVTSPELDPVNPSPFTQTFIYGSYDSKVTFYEPMITLEFLQNTTLFERTIPQPSSFSQPGYYPTKMKVMKLAGTVQIILDGFVYHQNL